MNQDDTFIQIPNDIKYRIVQIFFFQNIAYILNISELIKTIKRRPLSLRKIMWIG